MQSFNLPFEDLNSIFERLKEIWPKDRRILITGGTGYFGRWLIEAFLYIEERLNFGNTIILTTRKESSFLSLYAFENNPQVIIVRCDLNKDIQSLLKYDFSYILHAATSVDSFKAKSNLEQIAELKNNKYGAKNIIKLQKNKSFIKGLYVSSGAVYNSVDDSPIDELRPADSNLNIYSQTKSVCEGVFLNSPENKFVIARCFAFVGPEFNKSMAIMSMILKKINREKIDINMPDAKRSYMYMADLVVALYTLLFASTKHTIYNVGGETAITMKSLADMINLLDDHPVDIAIKPSTNIALAGKFYYPNITRIKSEFPAIFKSDLNNSLKKTYTYELNKVRNKIES